MGCCSIASVAAQSGGTISLWQQYLGDHLTFYGVDINPYCKVGTWRSRCSHVAQKCNITPAIVSLCMTATPTAAAGPAPLVFFRRERFVISDACPSTTSNVYVLTRGLCHLDFTQAILMLLPESLYTRVTRAPGKKC